MTRKTISRTILIIGILLIGSAVAYSVLRHTSHRSTPPPSSSEATVAETSYTPTERYGAQVDRVAVVFEQTDYTSYRLHTNGLIRTGTLNTERGYEQDSDATVYVLNWDGPIEQQMRYVRLTAEPNHLYYLDSNNSIIAGSVLTKE